MGRGFNNDFLVLATMYIELSFGGFQLCELKSVVLLMEQDRQMVFEIEPRMLFFDEPGSLDHFSLL